MQNLSFSASSYREHCETRRVVKNNPKGCNVIILMEKVVFWNCGIYHFLNCKKIPPISGDFYGKICKKKI